MARIEIKNLGPIKEAKFDLNKVNVFMGPQSSGKSTIAKIISFCTWLEKKYSRDYRKIIDDTKTIDYIGELKTYHRLTDVYFPENASFAFDGEGIAFSYNCDFLSESSFIIKEEYFLNNTNTKKWQIGLKKSARRQGDKVIYIPSERNFVSAIYNLNEYLRDKDLIQDFVNNWYEAKRKYSKERKLQILDLGVQYHNDGEDIDRLTLDNGKELTLQTASSGLQAVTPLITLFDYIANGIYNESRPMSVSERDELIKQYNDMVKQRNEGDTKIKAEDLHTLFDIIVSKNYQQSQLIIEEPEQNLFPTTQRDLIYYMLRVLKESERNHRLTFTTHSPYILYALNNCMMGYLVEDNMPEDEREELPSKNSFINPELVSVWQIKDGGIVDIKNKETGTIGKHYFNGIMNEVMEEYYDMLTYLKVDNHEK